MPGLLPSRVHGLDPIWDQSKSYSDSAPPTHGPSLGARALYDGDLGEPLGWALGPSKGPGGLGGLVYLVGISLVLLQLGFL